VRIRSSGEHATAEEAEGRYSAGAPACSSRSTSHEVLFVWYHYHMKHLLIPTVNVFIINGSKIMLGRRANTGWMDGRLCPPGGHIEAGETPVAAAIREIKEELGVTVQPKDLTFACVAVRNTQAGETVAFEFTIHDKDYTYINAEPEKCSELTWLELTDLGDQIIDQFKQIIEGIIKQQPYLEIGY